MPNVCRVGDVHGCGAIDTSGSPNVFVNGKQVHRRGDSHSHSGVQTGASSTVFANGIGIARIGDGKAPCLVPPHPPGVEASGSPDVFAG